MATIEYITVKYKWNSQQHNRTKRKRIGNVEELSANIKGIKNIFVLLTGKCLKVGYKYFKNEQKIWISVFDETGFVLSEFFG